MRWSTKQRIEFIETRLYWEGKISRKDLTGYFDISIPQSTKDIKAYIEKAPDNIRYDSKAKQYVAAEGFEPVLISPDSETYLQRLLTSDPGQEEFFCGSMPSFYNAPCIQRKIDPKILKYILKNINEGNAVHVEYQSMSGPGPAWRWITPHAIGFDGFRWHARAFCHKSRVFKDFNLGRIYEIGATESNPIDPSSDFQWFTDITFIVEPHPGLTEAQSKGIERDYGMTNGFLEFEVSGAFIFYMLKRLNLEEGHEENEPIKQQIVLKNREQIENQRQMLEKMSINKIEETIPRL
nr:WYL domain-containing protein [uncultured Desulfobacter sp.]